MPHVRSVAHSEDRPWSFDWTLKRKRDRMCRGASSHLLTYGDVVAKVLARSAVWTELGPKSGHAPSNASGHEKGACGALWK
jgi:hypothetical protein